MRVMSFIVLYHTLVFLYFAVSCALTRCVPGVIFIYYYTYDNNGCSINYKSHHVNSSFYSVKLKSSMTGAGSNFLFLFGWCMPFPLNTIICGTISAQV